MHDGMPYGRNQGQGHSREVDRQSPTGLILCICYSVRNMYSATGLCASTKLPEKRYSIMTLELVYGNID